MSSQAVDQNASCPQCNTAQCNNTLLPLLNSISAGDQSAFADFYAITVNRVFRIALRVLNDHHDTEEAVHDTYMQVWKTASCYTESRGAVSGWLSVIARSRALDYRRRKLARRQHEEALTSSHQMRSGAAAGADQVDDSDVAFNIDVRRVLSELPALQQRMLVMSFFKGLSHQEIAGTLDIPLGTVKSHLRRSIIRIRESMPCIQSGLSVRS